MASGLANNDTGDFKLRLFQWGDVNGLVYVFVGNIGSFVLVIGILKGFGWPDDLIYNRVVPGICAGLLVLGIGYSYMAARLAKKERRHDVASLPFGLSTPVTMVYLFNVILPLQFGLGLPPEEVWKCGMAATFVGGSIEAFGSCFAHYVRRWVPRAAMLATVGGISLMWMGSRGLTVVYETPILGLSVLMIAMLGLIGGYKLPKKIPPLLVAMIFGVVMSLFMHNSKIVLDNIGQFTPPTPVITPLLEGFRYLMPVLATIVPVVIYNCIDTMDNVESAIVAGDHFNLRQALVINGVATCIGAVCGGILPNTAWIGQPGLKSSGCRIGFAWASAILFGLAGFLGIFNFLYHLIPFVVVAIMFIWCSQVMVSQGFVDTPRRYSAAIVIGLIPHIADLLYNQTTAIFNALNIDLNQYAEAISRSGAMWSGVAVLKHGSIITGMLWASIVCCIIDRQLPKAAMVCLIAAGLSFFGMIHSGVLGLGAGDSDVIIGYLLSSLIIMIFYALRRWLHYDVRYDFI